MIGSSEATGKRLGGGGFSAAIPGLSPGEGNASVTVLSPDNVGRAPRHGVLENERRTAMLTKVRGVLCGVSRNARIALVTGATLAMPLIARAEPADPDPAEMLTEGFTAAKALAYGVPLTVGLGLLVYGIMKGWGKKAAKS